MTEEEQRRVIVLTAIREGRLFAQRAAQVLGLSLRHVRRLVEAFRARGPAALAHGNRGRPAPNRLSRRLQRRVLHLARTTYAGFNDQHLLELLAEEHAIYLSRRTLRRWRLAAGLPSPRRRRPPRHRRYRPRSPQAGLLLQWDGSHHDWLQGRGPHLVLHAAIDDATNEVPAAIFRLEEDASGYLVVLREILRTRGIPVAIYGDRHGIMTTEIHHRSLSLEDQLQGRPHPLTQVGRALAEVHITWIPASSPQAKGRIERLWGTFQDRLVSELRRANATTLADANRVLAAFLPRYNARFRRPPAEPTSAYRPLPAALSVDDVCCFKYLRTVANDNTVRLGHRLLQLLPSPQRHGYAKARVIVHEHLDGTLSVVYQGKRLPTSLLSTPHEPSQLRARPYRRPRTGMAAAPKQPPSGRSQREPKRLKRRRRAGHSWTPAPDHPWRRYDQEARRKQLRQARVTFSRPT